MKVIPLAVAIFAFSLGTPVLVASAGPAEDYKSQCANCHGQDGKGKTKMGEKLQVRDLTDPAVQAKFTDEQAKKSIADGLKDEKTGKTTMPARKDKLSPEQIDELVKFVRAFKGQ
jgi:mono/diheme cytochrome c family protein